MYSSVLEWVPRDSVQNTEYIPVCAKTYTNPIYDSNFPDPFVFKAPDGYFYGYATQYLQKEGSLLYDVNVQCIRSQNLINWDFLGDVMPIKPSWSEGFSDIWCPNVNYHNGLYYMYFSAAVNPQHDMGIGVAVSDKPVGPFKTIGQPLEYKTSFKSIDPFAFDDAATGKKLLYKGSGGDPITVQELDDSRLCYKLNTPSTPLIYPDKESPFEKNLIEGSTVVFRNPYYYLYYVGDNYTVDNGYAVMVARSLSALGPFEKKGWALGKHHNTVLQGNDQLLSPGPQSIITDALGIDRILYCVQKANDKFNADGTRKRVLCMDTIDYANGWPQIYDGTPSHIEQEGPYNVVDTKTMEWVEF